MIGYQRIQMPITKVGNFGVGSLGEHGDTVPQFAIAALLCASFEVSLAGTIITSGTVTDLHAADDQLIATIECSGRACSDCGHIYTEQEAPGQLVRASTFSNKVRAARPAGFAARQPWSPVCKDWVVCDQRRLAAAPAPIAADLNVS